MLTKESSKIVELLGRNPAEHHQIARLGKLIGKKSYSWIFNQVKRLEKEGIVILEKKGMANFCSLNFENPLTFEYLSYAEAMKLKSQKLPTREIKKIFNLMPEKYFTLIITGSYAKGGAEKDSDLDTVVVVNEKKAVKETLNVLLEKGGLMIPKIHPYVFTKTEFLRMLLSKEANYVKLAERNRIIVFGAANYYLMLKEAIAHGFNG
ncbi:MAG: nucleotidyltransferase domain-containing protein [Candidatus Aenigmarchaeota archaeon]|nr:nucleotidyltransferase domain-containing protein [Candidatus Aenigmarchaeota archaeon]